MVKIPIGELNIFFLQNIGKYILSIFVTYDSHIVSFFMISYEPIHICGSYVAKLPVYQSLSSLKVSCQVLFHNQIPYQKKTAEAKADNMFKLKDNHLSRISMIYILLFLVCKMFTSWQHLIFIICLWNYSKHNNTYSLLIRLHSGHIFLFSFLNTYEICYRRSFVTK